MNKEFLAKKKEINTLRTDVNALKSVDESIWTNLDTINRTASTAKTKAEEGVAKADSALARNVFTDEEKAKLASITNPIIIKGRVDTVNDLPIEAVIGWFYFVGLESASSYEEYCYSENGWEYIGLSQEGVDLSNYYTKKQVDTIINELKAIDNSLGTRIDNIDSKASKATTKAEEGVAKADDALTKASSNTTNINTLKTDVKALKATDERIWTNLDTINKTASTAKVKAEEGVAKADDALTATRTNATNITNLQTDVTDLINEKNIMGSRLTAAENTLNNVKTTAETAETKADDALTATGTNANKIKALETNVKALDATDERIWTNLDTINKTASTAKVKAEEGVAKADDALTATRTNADNISTHETRLDSIDNTLSSHDTRITTAQQKANSVDEKVDATNKVVGQLSTSLQSAYNKINAHANDIAINRTTLGTQCKNLLKNTAVTKTVNGVTFTVNSDGTITANGTATSRIIFLVGAAYISQTGNYTYTGTPSGGASSTYSMNYRNSNVYKTVETGNGITAQFEGGKTYEAVIDIKSGVTISNLTFSPMLRDADITDSTYEPYKENVNKRLIKNKSDIAVNKTTLGYQGKNLLKLTLTTRTVSGITFTVNDDYSITLNGTATAIIWQEIGATGGNKFRKEKLIFTGNPAGTGSGAGLEAWYMNSTTGNKYVSIANGNILTESDYDPSGAMLYEFHINKGKTYNNVTFYPMLRYADITDDTYEPYKESVDKRITNNVSDIAINKSTLGYQRKNILNETGYLSSITSVSIGTFNISGNSITLTATGKDCYTKPHTSSDGGYRIPVEPDTDYILSWESDNTYAGLVYVFMNGNTSNYKNANNNGSKCLKFTTKSDTTFITIRLGVLASGNSITYSNIMLRYADIIDDTYEPYQPSVQEQTAYSLSVPGKSTSAAISYSGVPTLICLTPNTADSTTGGLYMINSAGAVVKLIEKTGVVVAADTASNTFTITNNTSTVMDVCISRCWGR